MKKISAAVVLLWIVLLACLVLKNIPGKPFVWTGFAVTSLLMALVLVNLFLDTRKK